MNTLTHATTLHTQAEAIAREAAAAEHAVKAEAKEANAKQIAELSADASKSHQAEHIRGLVAATMSQISAGASAATHEHAAHWQRWALNLADDISGRGLQSLAA